MKGWRSILVGSAAVAALIPGAASAQTPKQRELEARIEALERAFGGMQTELQAARSENAQLRAEAAEARASATKLAAAVEAAKPAPSPAPADGFTAGSGATRVKLGGFLKTVAAFSRFDDGQLANGSFGRDFYLPQQIPIGGRGQTYNDFSAKQTRLWTNIDTTVAGKTVKGYLEVDFQTAPGTQGSERTTNGYDLALRRAYVQVGRLTVGQDWSTFQNVAVLPESTDFIGPTEGTVFVRQPLVRYSAPVGKGSVLHLAIENPDSATSATGSTALVETGDDRLPDFVAKFAHSGGFGEVTLAGVVREVGTDIGGGVRVHRTGYGASLGAKLFLDAAKRYDVRLMATYGSGIGRYVGLNFAPDALLVPGPTRLRAVDTFAALAAIRLGWTPTLRSTVMGGFQDVQYPDGLTAAQINAFNKRAWSLAGNLFWTPIKGLDVGFEYRHGERILVSGASGQLDRIEFAAKYGF